MTSKPTTAAGRNVLARPLIHTTYCYVKGGAAVFTDWSKCICGVPEAVLAVENEARTAAERDVAALRPYLSHTAECYRATGQPCICGLSRILAETAADADDDDDPCQCDQCVAERRAAISREGGQP